MVDGFLVDHEPPTDQTDLSSDGIHFAAGDEVKVFDPAPRVIVNTPMLSILKWTLQSQGDRRTVQPAVCQFLATELDLQSPQKMLIL